MITMVGFPAPTSKLYYNWEKGIEKCGDKFISVKDIKDPAVKRADCFYQTNEIKPKFLDDERIGWHGKYMLHIKNSEKPFIVSESQPFREHDGWLRFGWNSYRWNDANWNNANVDSIRWDRFQKLTNIKFTDWNSPGDAIIIMGQKEGDSSLVKIYQQGYESIYDWIGDQISEIRKHSDRKIIIRPHPRNLDRGAKLTTRLIDKLALVDVVISENLTSGGNQGGKGLDADLAQAHCVVTYNSLSGVEAVVKGIPVFALDGGSMVHPVAHHKLSQIEKINYNIDLQDWKNKIAYSMWNKEDVMSGDCWSHLKPVYFGEKNA
jgi:hypothetical protein